MKYIGALCTAMLLGLAARLPAQAGSDTYHVVKGSNGQTYLLAQAATGGVVYTDVYFRIGSAYETDSLSGICVLLLRSIDDQVRAATAGRSIGYQSDLSPTQFGFHFTSGSVEDVIPVIRDQVMNARIDEAVLGRARVQVQAELDSIRTDGQAQTDWQIRKYLWGADLRKLDVYGDRSRYRRITTAEVNDFHDRFFLPMNNAVLVTGTFAEQAVLDRLQAAFRDFHRVDFNPELITHVIDFKPSIHTVQLLAAEPGAHRISVSYQQPGARQDREATYSAYMLSAMVNDPQSRIGRELRASGLLLDVKAAYDCNNFQGTFTLSADVPSRQYLQAFRVIDSCIGAFSRKDFFRAEDIEAERKNVVSEFNALRSRTHLFMVQVARYRFSGDENYFASLADSIVRVDTTAMRRYVSDYFTDRAGVKCVYTDTALLARVPAADRYYAISDSISDITFRYPQNVTDIDSAGYTDLHKLIQWLKINPDVYVQVNGFSDKGEFDKANDTAVINFIWNTPTFRKAMPERGKPRYLRTEMMRAMKIAIALYEAGIAEARISGTSMSFSSDDDQQAAANRKCTVTLEKIRPHMSLYEYHFGHKKN